ncbi:hypothetical protein WCU84_19625 [Dickeya chrysanthemi]|uniref:Uncharacterized protein n=1 Tax=Dickeya chrysanthemi TaxID=556 RepID=A0ABU8JTN5_DICCH
MDEWGYSAGRIIICKVAECLPASDQYPADDGHLVHLGYGVFGVAGIDIAIVDTVVAIGNDGAINWDSGMVS